MREAAAPTSEWAELFNSLSKQDTSDTIDTRSGDTPEAGPSVTTVKAVVTIGREATDATKPAENLIFSDTGKPSVASVTSVTLEGEKGESGAAAAPFLAVDISATLATEADALEERAALVEYGAGIPRQWAEGYAALYSMAAPSGFYPERWQRIVDAAGTFIDQWAAKAIICGWSDLDVFGCDPDKPDRRFDCMGLLLLLDRCEMVGIDEHGADLIAMPGEAQLRYRRRPLLPGTVSLWQLASLSPRDSDAR
jgi:hypothetical protein